MIAPALYSVWEAGVVVTGFRGPCAWRAQLHGHIGHFPTQEAANQFVDSVQHERSRPSGMSAAPDKKPKGGKK